MSKDRQAKRKEKIKKNSNIKEITDRFPSLVIFNESDAPDNNLNSVFKKLYRKMIFDLISKKEKTTTEKIVFEIFKAIKKYTLDVDSDSFFAKKILDNNFFENYYNKMKNRFSTKRFLTTILQVSLSSLNSFLIKRTNFEKYFPDYFFTSGYLGNQIYIKFFKIKKQKTHGGTIYQHFKKITVDNQKYEIHFSKHAIERISGRVFSANKLNLKQGEFFDTFCESVVMSTFSEFIAHANFEFCGFSQNQHLLCCYMPLTQEVSHRIEKEIFKNNNDFPLLKNHKYEAKLMKYFYFPFIVEGNKIICKSALLAGFSGTPEFTLKNKILNGKVDFSNICSESDIAPFFDSIKKFYSKNENNSFIFTDEFFNIMMLFHTLGSPQFFKGEWFSFPLFAKLSKEVLAIKNPL